MRFGLFPGGVEQQAVAVQRDLDAVLLFAGGLALGVHHGCGDAGFQRLGDGLRVRGEVQVDVEGPQIRGLASSPS